MTCYKPDFFKLTFGGHPPKPFVEATTPYLLFGSRHSPAGGAAVAGGGAVGSFVPGVVRTSLSVGPGCGGSAESPTHL